MSDSRSKLVSTTSFPFKQTFLSCSIAATVVLPSYAFAQSTSVLEEIVVTARKVEENLQQTPVAVSAFSSEALERRMVISTEDLSRVTPNLQFKSYSPLSGNNSAAQVFIRGIGQSDSSGGIDPGVGMYIDDVYMGRSVGGVLDFRDIANVQVLRGPQGTLFGRNTIGGAVILNSQKPGNELAGEVKLGAGSDNLFEFFGALDLPLGEAAAARVTLGSRQRDGYVTRIYDGKDLGNQDSYTVTGAIHLDPSDSLNVVLRADYTEEDENGSPFVFAGINENQVFPAAASVDADCTGATFSPRFIPSGIVDQRCANNATWNLGEFKNGGNTEAESYVENYGVSAAVTVDLSESISLKSVTAGRNLEWSGARDADNTYLTILSTQYDSEATQFSEELQFLINSDGYNGVVGLFYFDENVNDLLRVPFGSPTYLLPPPTRAVAMDYQNAQMDNENWAIFTNWNFDLTEKLSLSVGVRHTQEEKSIKLLAFTNGPALPLIDDGNGVFRPSDDLPAPIFPGSTDIQQPHGAAPPASGVYNVLPIPFSQDFDATTGSLSLNYDLSESAMIYASWSQGFKSGGFNQRFNDLPLDGPYPTPFDSEEAVSYELGIKSDLTDNFRLNAALFTTDYENMQLTYRVGIVPVLFNAGEATIKGAELEFTYIPVEDWIIEGSVGYLDDEIKSVDDIPGTTAVLTPDNELPFTPEWTANVGTSYDLTFNDLMLTPRVDVSYTDAQFFDAANSVEVAQNDAETIVNFSLKLADSADRWNLVLGIENLTDELYPIAGNSSLSTSSGYAEVIYSRPRSWYLNGTYNF